MADEHEGISETQITFYRVQGHNHDGENSSKIDLSKYDLSDIVDMSQFNSAVLSSVENAVIKPKGIIVGIGDAVLDLDGSDPSAPTGVTVTSTADPDSPGNILINVAWDVDADGANNTYIVELWKSTTGISGTYIVSRSAESTGNSHVFEWADNRSGDVGSVYYKVRVMAVSPMGIRSLAYEATVAPASDSSIPGAITFNDDFSNFDEGLKTTFRGFFVKLDDSSEFDVKQGRGEYDWQVSTNNTAGNFDTAANLKASGRSKSTYIVVNSLEVRASASAAKTNYYLRVRAVDSSNNNGPWVYYRSTAGGGSNGAGSSTAGNASAITILEISGEVDIQDGTITADQIQADTITADQIEAGTITADEIKTDEITADHFVSTLLFTADGDMKSGDYSEVSGSEAGWKIEGGTSGGDSGTAVFQSVTVRGVVNANSGYLGGTDGWSIDENIIQSGTGTKAVRIGTGGSGSDPSFIRLGTKDGWNASGAGIWMDPINGLVIGTGTGVFSASSTGVITASAGTIGGWSMDGDALYTGTKDVSEYTSSGITLSSANGGSLHAKQFYIHHDGSAYFKGLVEAATIQTAASTTSPRVVINPTAHPMTGGGASEDHAFMWYETNLQHANSAYNRGPSGSTQDVEWYPGFVIGTYDKTGSYSSGSYDNIRYRSQMAMIAPRFSESLAGAGILIESYDKVSPTNNVWPYDNNHQDDGQEGYIKFGTTQNTDIVWIMDYGIVDGVTKIPQTMIRKGGLVITGASTSAAAVYSTANSLYNVNGTLHWNGSPIGSSGGGVDSLIAGSNITLNPGGGTGDVTVTATNTTYAVQAPITLGFGTIGFDHILTSQLLATEGTAGAPGYSFVTSDSHTGMYHLGNDQIGFSVAASHRLTINTTGVHVGAYPLFTANGNSGAPSHSFTNATSTGMYYTSSNNGLNFSTAGNQRMWIQQDGKVLINKSSTSYQLHVGGTCYLDSTLYAASNSFHNGSCAPWSSNVSDLGSTSYYWDDFYHSGSTLTSDISLKENIEDATYGLDFINTLRPVTYTKKTGGTGRNGPRTHHGFIAQEIETLLGDDADRIALWSDGYHPAVAAEDDPAGIAQDEGYVQGLRYTEFIPVLAKGIQELSTKLEAAEARIAVLEG